MKKRIWNAAVVAVFVVAFLLDLLLAFLVMACAWAIQ